MCVCVCVFKCLYESNYCIISQYLIDSKSNRNFSNYI